MKFKFRRSVNMINPCCNRPKKLRFMGRGTVRSTKEGFLVRNYSADNFGTFDLPHRQSLLKEFWAKLKERTINSILAMRKKRCKKPRISLFTLFGAFCASVSVTVISTMLVIASIFLRYGGPYTSVVIPNLVSLDVADAIIVSPELFDYEIVYERNPEYATGSIISQSPLPNVTRKLYWNKNKVKIRLTVNNDSTSISLPELLGTPLRDALLILKSAGVTVHVTEEYSNDFATGEILFSSLPSGTLLKSGDNITLKVSIGKEQLYSEMPNLTGLNEYEAIDLLKSKNLAVGSINYERSKEPLGTVTAQSVAPNSTIAEGSKISFTLSGGLYYYD